MLISIKQSFLCMGLLLITLYSEAYSQIQGLELQQNSNNSSVKSLINKKNAKHEALPPDQAFEFSYFLTEENKLLLSWNIAKGHYLYKNKTKLTHANVKKIQMPEGTEHEDQFFGKQFIYKEGALEVTADLANPISDVSDLIVSYQGCSKSGICYPVINKKIRLNINSDVVLVENQTSKKSNQSKSTQISSEVSKDSSYENLLSGNILIALLVLLVAGAGLAFTPCILPMLPILLGLINRNENMTRAKTSVLSFAYALGIASMLAFFGVIVAKTGINLQIIFQKPIWLALFAIIFFALGLSMLGVFKISMPGKIQTKVSQVQNKLRTDNFFSLYVAGALSILVIGPCVAPPLIGALAFISTTNNSVLGGIYLFALGLGMGLPLTLFAIFSREMPKKSKLSQLILKLFAIIMFVVGLWLLSRIIPSAVNLILWGVLGLFSAFTLWQSDLVGLWKNGLRAFAVLIFLISGSWIIGGLLGNNNLFNPFTKSSSLPFVYVNSESELNSLLSNNEKVMFDLYADWCVACQEIEHFTLTDEKVRSELEDVTLIKLDVTSLDDDKQLIMNRFGLIGPPAILFFKNGEEIESIRKIGFISVDELLSRVELLHDISN